jgi:catalase
MQLFGAYRNKSIDNHEQTTIKGVLHMDKKHLTTNQGVPVFDNQNSLTVGRRGPVLLQDVQFIEKMAHFDRWQMVSKYSEQ